LQHLDKRLICSDVLGTEPGDDASDIVALVFVARLDLSGQKSVASGEKATKPMFNS
jgi:hypothetical protein